MKKFSEQFHTAASSVKMKAAEKRELRERVVSYMEYHPLPTELKTKTANTTPERLLSDPFTSISLPFANFFKYATSAAAFLLVLVPFIAERAVPGDALYAIKVHVNEEVISTLKFDGYKKVEWETTRLNRRISEARLLASEGRLTEAVEAEVAEAVKTHTENAKREIAALRTEDADTAAIASIELDTTLAVQSAALQADATEVDDTIEQGETVAVLANAVAASQADVAAQSSTTPAYEKLMARVEQNTTRIYELRSTLESAADSEQLADVTRRIEDINRAVAEAITIADEDTTAASNALVQVLQRTQKLIVYMTEIEVKQTVDIDTLVPVVLTTDEHIAIAATYQQTLAAQREKITQLTTQLSDEAIVEKITVGEEAANELTATLTASVEAGDFSRFNELTEEIDAIISDIFILIEQNIVIESEPDLETVEEDTATSTEEVIDVEPTEPEQEEQPVETEPETTEPDPDPEPVEPEPVIGEEPVLDPVAPIDEIVEEVTETVL